MTAPTGTASGNGQAPTASDPAGGNGQAPTPAQANNGSAPSGAPNGQAPTATQTQQATTDASTDVARMQQELAEARREAANYRTELKKRDDANLSAEQKRERDLAELQATKLDYELRLQRQGLEIAGYRLAGSLGIGDMSAALAILQVEHAADVEYDDKTGAPKGLDKLLAKVLQEHPALAIVAAGNGGQPAQLGVPAPNAGGPSNPSRSGTNGGAKVPLSQEYIDNLITTNPQEYVARHDEIRTWLLAHPQRGRR